MKNYKRKNNLNNTVDEMPTPMKKACKQIGDAEEATVTFSDLAGCDSVLLVCFQLVE